VSPLALPPLFLSEFLMLLACELGSPRLHISNPATLRSLGASSPLFSPLHFFFVPPPTRCFRTPAPTSRPSHGPSRPPTPLSAPPFPPPPRPPTPVLSPHAPCSWPLPAPLLMLSLFAPTVTPVNLPGPFPETPIPLLSVPVRCCFLPSQQAAVVSAAAAGTSFVSAFALALPRAASPRAYTCKCFISFPPRVPHRPPCVFVYYVSRSPMSVLSIVRTQDPCYFFPPCWYHSFHLFTGLVHKHRNIPPF